MTASGRQSGRILVTGHCGYIGAVLVPMLLDCGYDVAGVDSDLYRGCDFGNRAPTRIHTLADDVRSLESSDLAGVDAVMHLAALSNDALGELDPEVTYDINWRASTRLARLARDAGVSRFLFSSSCSNYGAAGDVPVDEASALRPLTAYAVSKVRVEEELAQLADERFSPTCLRNATAYGASPRLRLDLVLNDFVAGAVTSGRIRVMSDGTPWRPLVHVEDIARAFIAMLAAPRAAVHNQTFNIGAGENYRVRDLAEMVREAVLGSRIQYADGGGPDPRSYRVDFGKVAREVPEFAPRWRIADGVRQLADDFRAGGITTADLKTTRFKRAARVRELLDAGTLDPGLRRPAGVIPDAAPGTVRAS